MNEWMNEWCIYIALLLCIAIHPKRFTIMWGGLSSTTTSVQHPLGWCDSSRYRLQEETAAALHSSYDQWDPCGEGEQLQVPRCKHLRGPDLDCTHSNTGQESQAKTVPSTTAEEIQVLTSNPENFLFRGHRKCIDSQCGTVTPQIRTAKLCRESCA